MQIHENIFMKLEAKWKIKETIDISIVSIVNIIDIKMVIWD